MSDGRWLEKIAAKNQLEKVLGLNEYTKQFGVVLSEEQAQLILTEKNQTLREQERIEFGQSVIPKLIQAFCDSPYVYQDNYVESIVRLQDIFYLYKNESMDEMTDDELIEYMKKAFDGRCQGSLDYLEETALEHIARVARKQSSQYLHRHLHDGSEAAGYNNEIDDYNGEGEEYEDD